MKRIAFTAAAAMLLAGPWAVHSRAQDDDPRTDGPRRHARMGGPGADEERGPRPEFAERMKARIKEELGLSDEQSAKLEAAMKQRAQDEIPLSEKLIDQTKKLSDLVKKDAADAEIQAALDALKAARKEMLDGNEKFENSLASFLKPKQRAKMMLRMERHAHGRNQGRRGPPKATGRPDHQGDEPQMPPRGGEQDDDIGE